MDISLIEAMPGPMEGVMTKALINTWRQMGLVRVIVSPFLRISESVPPEKILRKFIEPYTQCGLPCIIQLMGVDPAKLGECAARLFKLGVKDINLNFGCPSGQVLSSGAGGGVLRTPAKLMAIVNQVKSSAPEVGLSVKIRAGFTDFDECFNILSGLDESRSIDFIALHYRTVKEQYLPIFDSELRWQKIATLALKTPLVINGDINNPSTAKLARSKSGAQGVMCGRGLFRDPYLLEKILLHPHPLSEEKLARYNFFRAIITEAETLGANYTTGAAIELGNLIWGKENPFFEQLKTLNRERVATVNTTIFDNVNF